MNVEKTLAACRAEYERQMAMEKAATPGPWHVGGMFNPDSPTPTQNVWSKPDPGKHSGFVIASYCSPGNARLVEASRNLNPARLKIVGKFLASIGGWVDSLHAADEEVDTDDTESWGWQLTSAAVLLGVEVVE